MSAAMCLFSSQCLHSNGPLWETIFTASDKSKLSPALPAAAASMTLGHRVAHPGPNTSASLHVAEFPTDWCYLTMTQFSSFGRFLHSLKSISCPGKMWPSWKVKLFPLCYSTRCPLSCGFAQKQSWWEANHCFTPSFLKWDIDRDFSIIFFNLQHFVDVV